MSDISKFYKQVGDFKSKIVMILDQLKDQVITDHNNQVIDLNQEIKVINKYYEKLDMIRKVNPRMPIELLYDQGIKMFADQIVRKDESFFLGQFEELTSNDQVTAEIDQKDLLFIKQIRLVWDYLDRTGNDGQAVKDNIWKYVQVIGLLAEKVVGGNTLVMAHNNNKAHV